MKGFSRKETRFSLCGLNCTLCSMHPGGYCPGCGGGAGNQSCSIAKCSLKHGGVLFCWACPEYPCPRYAGFDDGDSFVPHRNRQQDVPGPEKLGWKPTLPSWRKSGQFWTNFWQATTTAAARRFSTQRSTSCPWKICSP